MEEKYKKIVKEVGFSYLTQGLQILIAPLLVILLTRVLSVEEFGIYSILSATVLLSISFLELGFTQYIVIKLSGVEEKSRIQAFFSIVSFEFLLLVFLSIILVFFRGTFLKLMNIQSYGVEFILCIVIILFGVIARMYFSYFTALQRLNFANFMYMLRNKGWTLVLGAFFLIFWKFTLLDVFFIWAAVTFLIVFVYAMFVRKDLFEFFKIGFSTPFIKKALYFGIPLIPLVVASWFITASDRYVLNFYRTTAIVGIYSLAYSLPGVITTLGATASHVIQPYFAEAWNKKEEYGVLINASLKYGLILILPAVTGLLFFGEEVITLLSGPKYLAAVPIIPTLSVFPVLAFLSFIYYEVLLAANKTKTVSVIFVFGAILNLALNFVFIPTYGMQGAAIATILSYFFIAIGLYLPSKKYIKLDHGFLKIPHIIVASFLMGVLVFFLNPETAVFKIISIGVCAGLYFGLLFLFRVFGKSELEIVKRFLHYPKRS